MKVVKLTPSKLFGKTVRYDVPEFQRRYVWEREKQWEPFWEDVEERAEYILNGDDEGRHFLGSIVLQLLPTSSDEFEKRRVVDGQQRLTTLQLLLDAVQEVLSGRKTSEDSATRLSFLVRNNKIFLDNSDPNNVFKVWPTRNDRPAFRHAMKNDLPTEDHKDSQIVRAHQFFREQVELWLDETTKRGVEEQVAARAIEKAVSYHLELVVIDLSSTDKSHIIFETLNARGTPLLQSEMIKNRLMYEVGSDAPETAKLWPFEKSNKMSKWWNAEIGSGRQRRPRIDIFFNNWLSMRRGRSVSAHDEFSEFDRHIKKVPIFDIADDLRVIENIYRNLDEHLGSDSAAFLYRRDIMQVGVLTPVLLWLASEKPPADQVRKALTTLESFLVRRMVCKRSAKRYGVFFMDLLGDLKTLGNGQVGDRVVECLEAEQAGATVWPSDEDLRDAFRREPLYWSLTRGRLRLVLEGIEGELRTDKAESRDVPRGLTIEHIMPQSWMKHWPLDADGDDQLLAARRRDRVLHTIGNLTLVNEKLNPSLSNGPWREKRGGLAEHSTLFLNKDVAREDLEAWDEQAIEERSQRLCEAAIKVWPYADAF